VELGEAQRLLQLRVALDLDVGGLPVLIQVGLLALGQLVQAAARAEQRAIPANGLTGRGYDGHTFWDTESYTLPVLTYTLPQAARDALAWRHSTLPQARARARELLLEGAAFPWRTIRGEECSGYWPAATAAFHINADIAWAVQRYVQATGDEDFERMEGLELLVESARLWAHLGHFGADERFHIHGVTGPDEYSALVDDNVYTNLMAARNLAAAADAATRYRREAAALGVVADEIAHRQRAAEAISVPFDERLGVHAQDQDFLTHDVWDFDHTPPDHYPLLLHYPYFELYRKQVVKQSDLVLALHLCGDHFSVEEKRAAFDYYEALTVRDSSLSACTQSVIAAEVGHLDLAYEYLAEAALMDIHDLNHNTADGVHIASLGGAVIAVIAGLGGTREFNNQLTFRPRLPDGLDGVTFNVSTRGARLRVQVRHEEATYEVRAGGPITIGHHGDDVEIAAGNPVTLEIPTLPDIPPAPRQPAGCEPKVRRKRI
jgi:alpha,alpha-trehalose phosphorylase